MIHEEICTYEVCKLAKEKGFNVQTFDWYDYTGNYNKGFIPRKLHECPRYKEYYAPTQGLLQRWLREERGIVIELKYSDSTESFRPFWSWQIYNTLGITLEIGEPNTTYELALEDALKYALENLV